MRGIYLLNLFIISMPRQRAERRHNTAVIKARRQAICQTFHWTTLEEGSIYYSINGEKATPTSGYVVLDKALIDAMAPKRQNTVRDADFEDKVFHHKASKRVTPKKAKRPLRHSGRKGRGVHPGAEYCPIDSEWAIRHAAKVQRIMAATPVQDDHALEDRSDTWVTGLSKGMINFMRNPAYALGRWNLGYRDADLHRICS